MKRGELLVIFLISTYSLPLALAEEARPCDAFVESIGIGDRFDWLWNDGLLANAETAIANLHIRYLRVGIAPESGDPSAYIDAVKTMASHLDAELCIQSGFNTWSDMSTWLDRWGEYTGTYAVEGPNESFAVPDWASGNGWTNVTEVQQQIWNYAHPESMEVYAWTLGGPASGYYAHTSDGGQNTANYCDYLNFHPYHWYTDPAGRWETKMNGLWQNCETTNSNGTIKAVRDMVGDQSKPYVCTEFGWCVTGTEYTVPMQYTKKYCVRNLFENFNAGVHRGFLFSLTSYGGAGQDYGLANHADGSLRENGQAVANTIALIQEPGQSTCVTSSLDYTLVADGSGTNGRPGLAFSDDHDMRNDEIHHTLLQKSDGTFYLVLWSDYDSHDGEDGWSQNATCTLAQGANSVEAYLPVTNGVTVVRDYGEVAAGGTVQLDGATSIPDHPLILVITPRGTSIGKGANGKPMRLSTASPLAHYTLTGRTLRGRSTSVVAVRQCLNRLFVTVTRK